MAAQRFQIPCLAISLRISFLCLLAATEPVRLRDSLGISETDAAAIEAELQSRKAKG